MSDELHASMARHPAGAADPPALRLVVSNDGPMPVPCAGVGHRPCFMLPDEAREGGPWGLCLHCGEPQLLDSIGDVGAHERDDLIARLQRGDFDETNKGRRGGRGRGPRRVPR